MALAKTIYCEPPNILEGENGLWDIYRRATMHVLALKLMEDLADCGVGTNQVEAEAKHREKQRRINTLPLNETHKKKNDMKNCTYFPYIYSLVIKKHRIGNF